MIETIGSSLSALFVLYLSLYFISCGVAVMFGGRKAMNKLTTSWFKTTWSVTRSALRVIFQAVENGARYLRSLL